MVKEAEKLLYQQEWRVIDQSTTGLYLDPLQSFGLDDTLCASVGEGHAPATARFWVHRPTVVLGTQDTRLPFLQDGLDFLKGEGYHVIVRNSGGLAVLLDEGVLNFTIVLPEKEKGIDINRGYEAMFHLIKEMARPYGKEVEKGEIVGSYCPGSYDLSIGGKKFAGISQRRLRHGVAVQIYLCVEGSGSGRAQVIKKFYDLSRKNIETKIDFPDINPAVMASLSELLEAPLTIGDVIFRLLQLLKKYSGALTANPLTEEEELMFAQYYNRIVERNKKVLN